MQTQKIIVICNREHDIVPGVCCFCERDTSAARIAELKALTAALDQCVEALEMVVDWDGGNSALLRKFAIAALDIAKKARV